MLSSFWIRDTAVYVLCKFIQLREAERRAPQFTSGSGARPGSGDGSQREKANDKQRNPRRIPEAAGILLLLDEDRGLLRGLQLPRLFARCSDLGLFSPSNSRLLCLSTTVSGVAPNKWGKLHDTDHSML